jgi:hypothetical protein
MEPIRILIDPRANLVYASQYIYGLQKVFGKKYVRFRMKPFKELIQKNDKEAFEHYMAILVNEEDKQTKVIIDFRDKYTINENAYKWCDIYGKLNLNRGKTDNKYLEKSIPIGPMIAPRIWGLAKAALMLIINYLRSLRYHSANLWDFVYGYYWQLKRPPLKDYSYHPSEDNYIFFDSSLWIKEEGREATNKWRASYIRICKKLDLEFQGGLFANKKCPEIDNYRDVLIDKFVSQNEYMKGIKRSTVVFNTPSIHGGHGWKLGEFLSMGKAIVSTEILNDMPEPLTHGENIHFVENEKEIEEGINRIRKDTVYRKSLEQGALAYYQKYIAPEMVIRRLLSNLLN